MAVRIINTTVCCDATRYGVRVTFENPFDSAIVELGDALDISAAAELSRSGRSCSTNARYAVGQPNGGERNTCGDHLALLIDESTPDWSGDMVAVRVLPAA